MTAAPAVDRRPRSRTAARRPVRSRWMVYGFCPLTGPWRQVVHAATAAGALVKYCSEHEMSPEACHVRPG
jgi:hypothetical protein